MTWTPERTERLKELWAKGWSAREIASTLGGVSRNAVIGKVHRLKLKPRLNPQAGSGPKVKAKPVAVNPVQVTSRVVNARLKANERKAEPEPVPVGPLNIDIMALAGSTCRYVTQTGMRATYCGHKVKRGAYCAEHAAMCYEGFGKGER